MKIQFHLIFVRSAVNHFRSSTILSLEWQQKIAVSNNFLKIGSLHHFTLTELRDLTQGYNDYKVCYRIS